MIKSYKVRIFPTKDQEQLIYKHIGCTLKLWSVIQTQVASAKEHTVKQ